MRTIFKRLCCLFILLGANTYGSTLLVLGDSLSAGYGIDPANGWVNLLQDDLGDDHKVVNGSISGDTTGGGLARLPLLLEKFQPSFCYPRTWRQRWASRSTAKADETKFGFHDRVMHRR